MLQKIILEIKNIDKKIFKLMINVFKVAILIAIFATYILALYIFNPITNLIFQIGLQLFKCSLMCISIAFICGFAFNKINI